MHAPRRAPDVIDRRSPDLVLFGAVLALVGYGVVMIFSSSGVAAYEQFGDAAYFLKRQVLWAALGFGGMFLAATVHYGRLRAYTLPLLAAAFVLLAAVLVPGLGRVVNGARRWIGVGPLTLQPVEVAKLALVLYLANFLANRGSGARSFAKGVVPPLLFAGAIGGLALVQPDMGSAVIAVATTVLMLFAGGAHLGHLAGVAALSAPLAAAAAYLEPYRRDRLLAFLDPWRDPRGAGFHIIQSLVALGSGGIVGVGLGHSRQKFFYLPERHTDFIAAIIGEELGFVGLAVVLLLFAVVLYRGMRISMRAPDRYGSLLAAGLTGSIVLQAILNVGVVTGSLPVTGVPLPFISFGGTSLVFTLVSVGILLNISQYAHGEIVERALRRVDRGDRRGPGRARP